ncbi:META domain-containing protein [Zobellia alginiliquefaciens]|uniref:META domain-containing protein n=1 Tax=Zobellia alginiliquefaciens TaxID=3032586 RepID=UPI0023E4010B|nr:META domain-containing protein [Zobellia alginiliquefaciens]
MKKPTALFIAVLTIVLTSCSSTKKTVDNKLYGTLWELEYLFGPRIAFQGLYPDRKPRITFVEATGRVQGTNSCNGYSAPFTINGNKLSFGEPGPTTMMFCGQGESFFLKTIKQITAYRMDDEGKLNLLMGDVSMMRFKPVENGSANASANTSDSLQPGCYGFSDTNNSLAFNITEVKGNKVKGELNYVLHEKDANTGHFSGKVEDNKLIGDYTFQSEGKKSIREVAFMIKDNALIEGYGPMDETGTKFKDRSVITFTSTYPLIMGDCPKQ